MKLPPPNAVRDVQLISPATTLRKLIIPHSNCHAHNFLNDVQQTDHCIWDRAETASLSGGFEISVLSEFPIRRGDLLFVEKSIFDGISLADYPRILIVYRIRTAEKGMTVKRTKVTVAYCNRFPDSLGKLEPEEAQWWSNTLDNIRNCFEGQVVLSRHGGCVATEDFHKAQNALTGDK